MANDEHTAEPPRDEVQERIDKASKELEQRLRSMEAQLANGREESREAPPAPRGTPDFEERGTEEQLSALYGALAQAMGEFTVPPKSKTVTIRSAKGAYSYDYAPLSDCIKATAPALAKHGLVILQPLAVNMAEGAARLRTVLAHKDGGRIVTVTRFNAASDIKDFGGQVTYMRRYNFNTILRLDADADADDAPRPGGNEVSAETQPRNKRRTPPQAEPKAAAPQASPKPTVNTEGVTVAKTPDDVRAQLDTMTALEAQDEADNSEPGLDTMTDKELRRTVGALFRELGIKGKDMLQTTITLMGKPGEELSREEVIEYIKKLQAKALEANQG